METEKTVNLSKDTDDESSKLARKTWHVINDQNNTEYGEGNENDSSIKFETKVIKSSLCDYSGEYRLVTGDITAAGGNNITRVAFKNWAPFRSCVTHINDEHIDTAENLDIMPMYNLIEYSDNYSDTSVSSWQFRRDKQNMNNGNRADVTTNDQHILNTNQLF